jgi:flagellin-specific chaperone FliS
MWATASDALRRFFEFFGLSSVWWSRGVCALFIGLLGVLLWRSFRRFAQASRLEQPDAFTLNPTDAKSLIGRAEDSAKLVNSVRQHRLVLLDGESGCGKSALISAGLVPLLKQIDSLLPVVIRDWGDDWVRGPLSNALDALFHAASQSERDRLGWTAPPDLAADTPILASDLDARLKAVCSILGRRALLITDQFDDYQARHRNRFLDNDANWLPPMALAAANRFWELVSAGLGAGHLHLLVVTRADTAAGLSCVRFLGEDMTATRTLARVEAEYLRRLLAEIAPDDARPAVVSHPEGGWQELRECLECDLKAQGAILMQQVRTLLLGLRQLPLLTPKHYYAAGGLCGVEALVISRAIRRAGDAVGGGAAGRRSAGAVLRHLVLPGGPDQPPKAQRASLTQLCGSKRDRISTQAILDALQHEEVVRPAEAMGGESAWQLDHDYLARAVLAQVRQTNRWAIALREGKARYDEAAGNLRRRYNTLLPVGTLVRICWERGRNRLRFGAAAGYAQMSAIKPAAAVLIFTMIGAAVIVWNQDRLLTAEANRLINRFGSSGGAEAVLLTWRAPEPLRQRVYELVYANEARLELAVRAGWHMAHAGLEPIRAREVATVLRERLAREQDHTIGRRLAQASASLAARLNDAADVKAEAAALRSRLEQERDGKIAIRLANFYATVAARLNNAVDVKAEAVAVRTRLQKERDGEIARSLTQAYAAVAAQMKEAADVKGETAALRAQLEQEGDVRIADSLARAYAAVATQLNEAAVVKDEVAALRARLEQEGDGEMVGSLALAYAAVAARLNEAADVKAEAAALRTRMEHERDGDIVSRLAQAYAAVAARLNEAEAVKVEAAALRTRLEQEPDGAIAGSLALAYGTVAARLNETADVKSAAAALRARLAQERCGDIVSRLAQAYAAVAARLSEAEDVKVEAATLRAWLERERNDAIAGSFAHAYAAVAVRLKEATDVKAAATRLRARLEQERNGERVASFSRAYATVAAQVRGAVDAKAEAVALRTRLEQESNADIALSLAQAYAALAVKLNQTDVKPEAAVLRTRLEQERNGEMAGSLALAYAAVAARLSEVADLKAEATGWRTRLEQERNGAIANSLAQAYAAVAGAMIKRVDPPGHPALASEILMLAGHPFLGEPGPLLAALRPVSGRDFGNNSDAAVRWAIDAYAISPQQLRPPPLSH